MKYKTTIEIISEAENKDEAIEIAGEYLSGNLVSGIEMKCLAKPARSLNKNILSIVVVCGIMATVALSAFHIKSSAGSTSAISGTSAIQPPLRTSAVAKYDVDFKKAWQVEENREALDYIKR